MATEEFRQRVIRGLVVRRRKELTFGKISDAIQAGSAKAKADILSAFKAGNGREAGNIIQHLVIKLIETEATVEADAMLADDNLTPAEVERVFFRN